LQTFIQEFPRRQRIPSIPSVQFNHQRNHQIQRASVGQPAAVNGAEAWGFDELHHDALGVLVVAADENVALYGLVERFPTEKRLYRFFIRESRESSRILLTFIRVDSRMKNLPCLSV
jgi:hypothetical protein